MEGNVDEDCYFVTIVQMKVAYLLYVVSKMDRVLDHSVPGFYYFCKILSTKLYK